MMLGKRQADLARAVGISAAYLNLIEHNKRRIGGKLLVALADELQTEVTALSQGAEAALVEQLREAVLRAGETGVDLSQMDELASRFPAWGQLIAAQSLRIQGLERTVAMLSDRLALDPNLSEPLHEVLSAATAIRSTAAILAETADLDPEWQNRFHRNLREDSGRLADGAQSLVAYLDVASETPDRFTLPDEEVAEFLGRHNYHLAALEGPAAPDKIEQIIADAPELVSEGGKGMAQRYLQEYAHLAQQLPLSRMLAAVARHGLNPDAVAQAMGADMAGVLRRLATLPADALPSPVGLVTCDAAGALLFRKPLPGFAFPRYGSACVLWPLFRALARPMTPLRERVEMAGQPPQVFLTYSLCQPVAGARFDGPEILNAAMLIVPPPPSDHPQAPIAIGGTCRTCARSGCPARREPSILADGF